MNERHFGSSSEFDITLASDRRMIERAFLAAGEAPSRELLAKIPEVVATTLAAHDASHRDKARALSIVQKMQSLQLDTLSLVNAIKSRRDRRAVDVSVRPADSGAGVTAIDELLAEIEANDPS